MRSFVLVKSWREELRTGKDNQSEVVEILRISEVPGRAFAEVKTADGRIRREEISLQEARREKKRLKQYRVVKKRPRKNIAPAVRPVIRIGTNGIVGFGSNLVYKGTGPDGCPEYWHIPTATVLVEDVSYATRQMAVTLLMLKRSRSLI